ncbi:Tol-Pal system beta propeller repeat protein TolB [Undibacterium sp. RuRC25W]|uniref:Tol-Pal system beta propeller repeat protein TolB n=1 Tax=Undibacterium sp. RuRC25W TaxID=3413047 RepID=UPI003BF08790
MIKKMALGAVVVTGISLSGSMPAYAQLRVEVSGVGSTQIPVAIASFANEGLTPQQITNIIKDDLSRSGYFKIIDAGAVVTETTPVNFDDWKKRGAEALVVGSVQSLADGRFDVRYKLLDTIKSSTLSGFAVATSPINTRLTAHKIADDIYEKLIGVRGAFSTRIAYVTKSGSEYRLEVADADGEGVRVALRSNEPIISPAWSADGTKVAYVSFEAKKPVIWVQNLVTGERKVVANYKGSNSAPAWSPDGSRLAIALSRDGLTQIYTIVADGSGLKKLTSSSSIDTEPQFSADGESVYFLSDRSGGPQIYRINANGGEPKRVTFNGSYNITPRISPDGRTLAYISRREGKFQLYALDLVSGQEQRLSDTTKDESPSFSPNGRYIMYATESGRRAALAVVSVDGKVKQRLTVQAGDIREPTWGPFMK